MCRPFNSPPIRPFGELFLCHPSLRRVIFVLSNPWVSYFRAIYLILHPLASYFRADHLTLRPSIPLASYFCTVQPLGELFLCLLFDSPSFGELFSCRPFNSPPIRPFGELFLCHPSLRRVIFVLSNPWVSYSRAIYLILHPLASYFRADHLTLRPSIPLASYFCTVQPLGELFSCLLFDSPSFGELFLCRPFNSPPIRPFGELFLCHPSLRRVIFVLSNPWASYFRASPSFGELFSCFSILWRVIFVPTI